MRNKFRSSRSQIHWAKEYLLNFNKLARVFFDRKPYAHVVEMDDEKTCELHKVKFTEMLPPMIEGHAFSVVNCLRAALDTAAYSVAIAAKVAGDNVHFPFAKTVADIKSRINSTCKGFPNEITALFSNFKPYRGGDDLLWALNALCNTSKHRLITPMLLAAQSSTMTHSYLEGGGFIALRWDSEKQEVLLGGVRAGHKFHYNFNIAMDIVFGEVEIVRGQPVSTVLATLLDKVTSIIDATETETRRIGLI